MLKIICTLCFVFNLTGILVVMLTALIFRHADSHPHPPGSDIVARTCVHADETQTHNRLLTINTTFPPSCGSLYCVYIQKRVLDTLLTFFLFCFEFMTVVLFSSKYLVNKLLPLFPISLPFSLCSFGFQLRHFGKNCFA